MELTYVGRIYSYQIKQTNIDRVLGNQIKQTYLNSRIRYVNALKGIGSKKRCDLNPNPNRDPDPSYIDSRRKRACLERLKEKLKLDSVVAS